MAAQAKSEELSMVSLESGVLVIPAKAGIHKGDRALERKPIAAGHDGTPRSAIPLALRVRFTGQCTGGKRCWIPAFAGMTGSGLIGISGTPYLFLKSQESDVMSAQFPENP